jgi:outer membrane protein assembly factor BamE (lipoprotein component of BamABCDE complex)
MRAALLYAIVAIILVTAGPFAFQLWKSHRFPVNASALQTLKPGATEGDVKRVLGPPKTVHDLYGDHRWCYYRTGGTRILYVVFDTNKLFKSYELDD